MQKFLEGVGFSVFGSILALVGSLNADNFSLVGSLNADNFSLVGSLNASIFFLVGSVKKDRDLYGPVARKEGLDWEGTCKIEEK